MTNKWRDKIIAEALTGEDVKYPPKFDDWKMFGIIMDLGQKREWWKLFVNSIGGFSSIDLSAEDQEIIGADEYLPVSKINPTIMYDDLSTWLKEHEGEWRGDEYSAIFPLYVYSVAMF